MSVVRVILLPGIVLPAELAYGGLIAALDSDFEAVAKDLEVGWIAAFSPGVESRGGEVSADAKLAGTVGEPQFIGDVRWKNGELVATMPPRKAAPPSAAALPQAGARPSPR